MKKSLLVGLLAVSAILLAMSLSAQENAKIKLPDGLYLYNFEIRLLKDGSTSLKSTMFFLVQNNVIYSELDALKKYGAEKINKLFTENKNFKLLSAGENIGKLYQVEVRENGQVYFETELNKNPMYRKHNGYIVFEKCIAVPEGYKETKIKQHNVTSEEEISKVSELINKKLFSLVKDRKEFAEHKNKKSLMKD